MKIVIGSDHAGVDLKGNLAAYIRQLVHAFPAARYTGEERHARRLAKVQQLEEHFCDEYLR